ncbi:MAG: glycosyltransferase, partial [Chloroflexota bacterium]
MKIRMFAVGSRGDVQPILALSKGLQAAGHEISLVASTDFADWVRAHGIAYIPVDIDMQAMINSEMGRSWIESGANPFAEVSALRGIMHKTSDLMTRDLMQIAEGADLLVSGFTTAVFVAPVAEKLGIRHISAILQPMFPTRAGWGNFFSPKPLGNTPLNLAGSFVFRHTMWFVGKNAANRFRGQLGLQTENRRQYMDTWLSLPQVIGVSPSVMPPPDDYPDHVRVAGYWFLDEPYTPPDELRAFLEAGPPPVYIGFGSMAQGDPAAITSLILDALHASGCRGLVNRGWAGLDTEDIPDDVMLFDGAPHSWLFPHTAGVAHHGGAGTTAAGLRAGVPSTVVPHYSDQPYWARRVHELGAGPKPIPR